MFDLEVFWYIIIVIAMASYAMLDGFDLGVGSLHLFCKKDEQRRVFLNAIGPVWDGNEVWLVVFIGGLFAGFPFAYATLFSAMYTPLVLLVCGLIFRAVAIEFRSKVHSYWWRQIWDILFCFASISIAFGLGVALGNFVEGIPLNENHDYVGTQLTTFLRPYPLLVGVLTLSLFVMHGATYLVMKTEGEIHDRLRRWIPPAIAFFILFYAITTLYTLVYKGHMSEHLQQKPYLFFVVIGNLVSIAAIPFFSSKGKDGLAFLSSCVSICFLMALFALGTYPNVVRSSLNPETNSLTVQNSVASHPTLVILTIIVAIGLPFVIAYSFYIHRLFMGKVKLDHMSY